MAIDPETTGRLIEFGGIAGTLGPGLKQIVGRMFGPTVDVMGRHLADHMAAYLARNAEATIIDAAKQVEASGAEAREIPLRTAVRLIEGAAREDSSELRARWAALIANAAIAESIDDVPPAFATILAQLSPFDTRVLELIRGTTPLLKRPVVGQGRIFLRFGPGEKVITQDALVRSIGPTVDSSGKVEPSAAARTIASVDLIVSLGLATRTIEDPPPDLKWAIKHARGIQIQITVLGQGFLAACTAPSSLS